MVKIIEARAILTASDQTGKAFSDVIAKMQSMTAAQKMIAQSGMKDFGIVAKAMADMSAKAGAIDGFRAQHAALVKSRQAFREAETNVRRLAREMEAAEKPSRQLSRSYEEAQRSVRQASASYQEKAASVKAARAEMAQYGVTLKTVNAEQNAAAQMTRGNRRYQNLTPVTPAPLPDRRTQPAPAPLTSHAPVRFVPHQQPPVTPHPDPNQPSSGPTIFGGNPAMIKAGAALYAAKSAHNFIVDTHHKFQEATLYQQGVLNYTEQKQKTLQEQAIKIGQDTKFSNADIVMAQTSIGGKLPKEMQTPGAIKAITEHTKNYALAFKVSMEEGADAVISWMKTRGYDVSTPAAAEASARKATNQLVTMKTTSGMQHHDVLAATKFGAAPGRAAGFSESFSSALAVNLKRIGYEGAMAGTFERAIAMKLSAPSRKGMAAIAGMGLNFNDYVTPGTEIGTGGLDKMLQQRFGRGLDEGQKVEVDKVLSDDTLTDDRGKMIEALTNSLNSTFAKKNKKDGRVNAQDAERIAKTVDEFLTLTAKGVDAERLFMDLLKKGLTPAQARAIGGAEHGGRMIGLNPGQVETDKKTFETVPENRAKEFGDNMQRGAQGEYTKMLGSIETFGTALGAATDGLRSFTYKGLAGIFDALTWMVRKDDKPTIGGAISGKNWTPKATVDGTKESEELAELDKRIVDLKAKIANNEARSKNKDALELLNSPLKSELGDLTNRAEAARKGGLVAAYDGEASRGRAFKKLSEASDPEKGSPERLGEPIRPAPPGMITPAMQKVIEKVPVPAPGASPSSAPATAASPTAPTPVIDTSNLKAKVESPVPVDVTGKVGLDPSSKVDVNVWVQVQGPAQVTGQSVTASGNAKGSVGTNGVGEYGGAP